MDASVEAYLLGLRHVNIKQELFLTEIVSIYNTFNVV